MPELRKDMVRDSWVIIVTDHALKPADFPINRNSITIQFDGSDCPFCEGHEAHTTGEIAAVRLQGTRPNTPGWLVRSVPNKFPVFNLKTDFEHRKAGFHESVTGLGHHEVVVETPWHYQEIHQRDPEHIAHLFCLLRQRYQVLKGNRRLKYIQIYKNRGLFAGASQQHGHSQILAYPIVPAQNAGIGHYYQEHRRCLICDTIKEEAKAGERIVCESEYFLLLCPYASRFSYETWIIPKAHKEHFGDISDAEIKDLAVLTKEHIGAMMSILEQPAYNIIVNSAPVNSGDSKGHHWFVEIIPRLMVANAVEIATGFFMNPVAPERSAQIFSRVIESNRRAKNT